MKTRTKGLIIGFIFVFAMLIGVFTIMPMTASAAPSDVTEWSVYIGGQRYYNQTYIDRRESSGWVFDFRGKQPILYLYDYKASQNDGIYFGTNPDSEAYLLTVYVYGDCIVNGDIGTSQIAMGPSATLTVNNGGFDTSKGGGAYFRKINPTDTTPSYIRATREGIVMSQYWYQTFNLSDNIHVYFESATDYPYYELRSREDDGYYPKIGDVPRNSSITCATKSTDANIKYTETSGNLINGGYRTVAADGKSFTIAHPDYVAVTNLTSGTSNVNVYKDKTVTLNPTIYPNNATVKKIVWTSTNTNVATVDSQGVVTGKNIGTSTITGTSFDGKFTVNYNITVSYLAQIKEFEINIDKPVQGLLAEDIDIAYDDEHYTAEVIWLKNTVSGNIAMGEGERFEAGKTYSARVKFTLKESRWFHTPSNEVYATINENRVEKAGIEDNTVTFLYAFDSLTSYNVTIEGGYAYILYVGHISSAAEGTEVRLSATTPKGYEFVGWESSDVIITGKSFIMPAKNVSVRAIYEDVRVLKTLDIYTNPTKTTYNAGDRFDKTGLRLTATFTDGTTKTVEASEITVSGNNALHQSQTNVTVSYTSGGKTISLQIPITVNESIQVNDIIFSASGYKVGANVADFDVQINTPGIQFARIGTSTTHIHLFLENGTDVTSGTFKADTVYKVTIDFEAISGYQFGNITTSDVNELLNYLRENVSLGNATVQSVRMINGTQFAATFKLPAIESKELTGISVTNQPIKTEYFDGNSFDPNGMVVKATYSDSSNQNITEYTILDGAALSAGQTYVTVQYQEGVALKTATVPVTVDINHIHSDADGLWESNGTQHFHTCECGTEFDYSDCYGGTATDCKTKAKCDVCGNDHGDFGEHTFNRKVEDNAYYVSGTGSNCTEKKQYYYLCKDCNEFSTTEKYESDNYGSHNYQEVIDFYYVVPDDVTCQEYYSFYPVCEHCEGKDTEHPWESTVAGDHALSENYTQSSDTHYKVCTVDGCDHTDTPVNCSGGTATCQAKAVCDTCKNAYGDFATHSYTTVNGYKESDGHANTCSCGAHDTVVPHTPNIENATEDEDKVCTECGYIIQNKLSHTHVLKPVAEVGATCTTDGVKAYYACDCGSHYAEDAEGTKVIENLSNWKLGNGKIAAAHTPNADDGDCTTEITCSVCGETTTAASTHADTNNDEKCDACGKDMPTTPGGDEPGTEPGTTPGTDDPNTPDDPDKKDGLGTGAIVGIVIGSVAVAGVGGVGIFALVWFVIKKKTWAEFLAIFKKG